MCKRAPEGKHLIFLQLFIIIMEGPAGFHWRWRRGCGFRPLSVYVGFSWRVIRSDKQLGDILYCQPRG